MLYNPVFFLTVGQPHIWSPEIKSLLFEVHIIILSKTECSVDDNLLQRQPIIGPQE